MSLEYPVKSLAEYLALPELDVPGVPDEKTAGTIYRVVTVGFCMAAKAECEALGLEGLDVPEMHRCALPTAVMLVGEEMVFVRLPQSLVLWAYEMLALPRDASQPVFPAEVEFGILRDRHYVKFVQV